MSTHSILSILGSSRSHSNWLPQPVENEANICHASKWLALKVCGFSSFYLILWTVGKHGCLFASHALFARSFFTGIESTVVCLFFFSAYKANGKTHSSLAYVNIFRMREVVKSCECVERVKRFFFCFVFRYFCCKTYRSLVIHGGIPVAARFADGETTGSERQLNVSFTHTR